MVRFSADKFCYLGYPTFSKVMVKECVKRSDLIEKANRMRGEGFGNLTTSKYQEGSTDVVEITMYLGIVLAN